ncbi:MAG: endo-1,4-beta-xylanase, partial [Muribaculaceae bacterium]|nr:endo-1,4-beta-xylanase [Muribaculaceae bacterium]
MKTYNKLLAILAVGTFLASCDEKETVFVVEKPESLTEVEALNSWDNLKSYIDRGAYPNFKLGCALGATDYSARGIVYRVANANFDEVTLGNAMKYASVVGDDGTMNFGTITDFLDATEGTGISVYGHTLAWHAQQNKTYLNSLLADHKVEIGYDDFISDVRYDFEGMTEVPFNSIGKFSATIVDGVLHAECSNKNHKFYIVEDAQTEVGTTYQTRIYIKGSKNVSLPIRMDGADELIKVPVTTDWQELTITGVATQTNTCIT